MKRVDLYRQSLLTLNEWDDFLLRESGLPGKRANLELLQAVVEVGEKELFERYAKISRAQSPTGSREEFLVMCGVVGYGKVAAQGNPSVLSILRPYASDVRWRIREAVAMALQYYGRANMSGLLAEMQDWSVHNLYEQRAVVAGLCEPELLKCEADVLRVLGLLDQATLAMQVCADHKSEEYRVLRQALAYCWSVAVAALPDQGSKAMERWLGINDPDVRWVMKENLRKKRLRSVLPQWVEKWLIQLA